MEYTGYKENELIQICLKISKNNNENSWQRKTQNKTQKLVQIYP